MELGRVALRLSDVLRLGFLASHEGSTMQAILDACRSGELDAEPVLLISNNSRSRCVERAAEASVRTMHLSSHTHPDPDDLDHAILDALLDAHVDVVILAGYMKKLGAETLSTYQGRILNSHPALLPDFGGQGMYGDRVHQAVIESAVQESGCTIHLVDDEYDHGAIVSQRRVPVLSGDTSASLANRVREQERVLYQDTIARIAHGDILLPTPTSFGHESLPDLGSGAACVITDSDGRVLLVHENYGHHRWSLPGGRIEAGETASEAAAREAVEETGLRVEVTEEVGTYTITGPRGIFVATVFATKPLPNPQPAIPDTGEIRAHGWYSPHQLPTRLSNVLPWGLEDWVRGRRHVRRLLRDRYAQEVTGSAPSG